MENKTNRVERGFGKNMKKSILGLVMISLLLVSVVSASMLIYPNDNAKANSKAPDNSEKISVSDSGDWGLERVDYVHYAKGSKPGSGGHGGGGSGDSGTSSCYQLTGYQWKSFPENYVINPTGSGLSSDFVTSAISSAAETWDAKTNANLFGSYTVDTNAQVSLDGKNSVVFGNYPQAGVIGVTSVWRTRKGKQIVEFDVMLDTDFTWGDANANPALMDVQNIATHELGHALGLDDIYSSGCKDVTMYGYSGNGETSKRTLEQADITGLQQMYGL